MNLLQFHYYIAPREKGPWQRFAKGKLVDKYKNVLKKLRNLNMIPRRKREGAEEVTINRGFGQEVTDDLTWLKHNSEPWFQVESSWKNTFEVRKLDVFSEQSSDEYTQKWPQLKGPNGHLLVSFFFFSK